MKEQVGADRGQVQICGYVPGALGRITELHAVYYHRHWGFDLYFEALVATELAAFLRRMDPAQDGFWLARIPDRIVGSVAIDGAAPAGAAGREDGGEEGARLRWFILDPQVHGLGVGKRLMGQALDFCARAGHRRVYLWTFAGLDAARAIYERHGFTLCREHEDSQWGRPVTEQMFELRL